MSTDSLFTDSFIELDNAIEEYIKTLEAVHDFKSSDKPFNEKLYLAYNSYRSKLDRVRKLVKSTHLQVKNQKSIIQNLDNLWQNCYRHQTSQLRRATFHELDEFRINHLKLPSMSTNLV